MKRKNLLTYTCYASKCGKNADIKYSWQRANGDKMVIYRCFKHPLGTRACNDWKKEILNLENKKGYDVKGWRKCLRCFEWKKLKKMCQEHKCSKCSGKGETCIVW